MRARPSVSIAMATFNGARFIEEQLKSIANQTILPNELIVTDDCSTDDTLNIISSFAHTAAFPVHIEKNSERLGYRANFLKAANLCKSDIIAFSDQDDVWLPKKLDACLASFDSADTLLVYHNALITTETLQPITLLQKRKGQQTVNPPLSFGPWQYGLGFTQLFRRSLLGFSRLWPQSVDFYNSKFQEAHDQWFFFLASSLGSVDYIDEPLVLYRQHGTNTFGWNKFEQTIKGKLINLFSTTTAGLHHYERSADRRANILEEMKALLDGANQERSAHEAAAQYRGIQQLYLKRRQIYYSQNIFGRINKFIKAFMDGCYRPKRLWGVGYQAMIRDLICGVIFSKKIKAKVQ